MRFFNSCFHGVGKQNSHTPAQAESPAALLVIVGARHGPNPSLGRAGAGWEHCGAAPDQGWAPSTLPAWV